MAENSKAELIQLCRQLASHPSRLAMWNEGSVAMKISDSSFFTTKDGVALANVTENDLPEISAKPLLDCMATESPSAAAWAKIVLGADARRPCVDVGIYAYLFSLGEDTFAAHTQPVEINQIVSSPRARQFADRRVTPDEIASCGITSVLVPYAEPGFPLAKEVARKVVLWRDRHRAVPKVVLVQNHGMIVLGASSAEVLQRSEMMIKAAQVFIGAAMMGGPVFLTPAQIESTLHSANRAPVPDA
jgi:ribulose-5-phosphate 4-epimerase/fuculose-1-phosphate aldolase